MRKYTGLFKKSVKKGVTLTMALALALLAPSSISFISAAKVKKPALVTKKKTLYYDECCRKIYTLKLKNIKASSIASTTWKTSNKKIVSLSRKKDKSVMLTAKKKGKATITATVKYIPKGKFEFAKKKLTCKVTSKKSPLFNNTATPTPTEPVTTAQPLPTTAPVETPIPVQGVSLNKQTIELYLNETFTLEAGISPDNAADKKIIWTSSDNDIASVSENGVVTAKKAGDAVITATAGNGIKAECSVRVTGAYKISTDTEKIKLEYNGGKSDLTLSLKGFETELKKNGSAWSFLEKFVGIQGTVEKYYDIDGDGSDDTVKFENTGENTGILHVTAGGNETGAQVEFSKSEEEIRLILTLDSGEKYTVRVKSDNKNKIIAERNDGEAITAELTDAGYTIIISDGFGVEIK